MTNEIAITEISGIRISQTENVKSGTGCTVFISESGMRAGVDVRGGGPASRETELLNPLMSAEMIHAVVISGGSAFGLCASNGVMKYLEENNIGFDVGITRVPLVVQSCLFDLTVGDKDMRPDLSMGYEAARLAFENPNYRDGNYGAGCGCTVGKIAGMNTCMKTGIGSFAVQTSGGLQIGAVVALNALGDVFDYKTCRQIAGLLTDDKKELRSTRDYMIQNEIVRENKFVSNTTLGVVITNAKFTKSQLCKISGMSLNGYARSINPVNTSADGDTVYALSVGDHDADMDLVGTLAADALSEAVIRAVESAEGAYGFPSAKDVIISRK